MSDDVLRHLQLGFIRLHVLYHADKEPICGVELIEELRHHGYRIGPGTLYPVLHQLENAGLLKSVEQIVDGKRRKNVRITAAGKRLLAHARTKLKELAAEILDDKDARQRRQ
jgi:DNA-binding PadR family transcriptional regulator